MAFVDDTETAGEDTLVVDVTTFTTEVVDVNTFTNEVVDVPTFTTEDVVWELLSPVLLSVVLSVVISVNSVVFATLTAGGDDV